MKKTNLLNIILHVILFLLTITYVLEPFGYMYFEMDYPTTRYLMENGYYLKVSLIGITLIALIVIKVIKQKSQPSKMNIALLSVSVVWLVLIINDFIVALRDLDGLYYGLGAMTYRPFNNSLSNPINWIAASFFLLIIIIFTNNKNKAIKDKTI
ncbi:MAG: hypothetical protein GX074_03660 [Erysipelothrix sp.]|nr:hypothetical protein [Erysipelothrix sp.]